MYDIRVIRENKNALVNYINALHIFSKNLEVHYLNLCPNFFSIPRMREDFLKVRGPRP